MDDRNPRIMIMSTILGRRPGRRIAGQCRAGLLSACAGFLLTTSALFTTRASAGAALPSETPGVFVPRVETYDYVKREVMIPMRDGVKLQTIILIPRASGS